MRKKVIAGNWKMYKTPLEAQQYFNQLLPLIRDHKGSDILVFPPDISLATSIAATHGSNVCIGAQNMHWKEEGAYTGQISPRMLKAVGATHVLIGHSEIRTYNAEIDENINLKVRAALAHDITPIVCIGEALEERESDLTKFVLLAQLGGGLAGLDPLDVDRIIVAYEPVWAIGTGQVATPEQAEEAHQMIRNAIGHEFGEETAAKLRILYGGSVKPANIASLLAMGNIDGALIGGGSLEAEHFAEMIQASN